MLFLRILDSPEFSMRRLPRQAAGTALRSPASSRELLHPKRLQRSSLVRASAYMEPVILRPRAGSKEVPDRSSSIYAVCR